MLDLHLLVQTPLLIDPHQKLTLLTSVVVETLSPWYQLENVPQEAPHLSLLEETTIMTLEVTTNLFVSSGSASLAPTEERLAWGEQLEPVPHY